MSGIGGIYSGASKRTVQIGTGRVHNASEGIDIIIWINADELHDTFACATPRFCDRTLEDSFG